MFDAALRPLIDPPLAKLADRFIAAGFSANAVTLSGFAIGMLAIPALAAEWHLIALILILLNRLADGIDGAIARRLGATDLGGYLDILCDFIFYAAVPLGIALARPEDGAAAAFLIFSFVGTGSSFLAYAAIAAKRGLESPRHGQKTIYYLGGLTEGTETIIAFILFCLMPGSFAVLAVLFGTLCWITTLFRALSAWRLLTRG
jgi:phosphatidylglycerophosphate synthase